MTIDTGLAAVIGAAIAVIGGAVGGVISLFGNYLSLRYQRQLAEKARKQAEKDQRKTYLKEQLREVLNAHGIVEGIFARFDKEEDLHLDLNAKEQYGKAIGHAEAACLAAHDDELLQIKMKMTPYLTGDHRNVNRTALHDALVRLGKMIDASDKIS